MNGRHTLASGYRVIRTIGKELTAINYQRGFCIEFASTLTVVLATILEMPVSTTHCQVGRACLFHIGRIVRHDSFEHSSSK